MTRVDQQILDEGTNAKLVLYQDYITRIQSGDRLNAQEIKRFEELDQFFKSQKDESDLCRTLQAAADYCGVTERKIRYAVREAKRNRLRQNSDGTFDKSELDRWLSLGAGKDGRKRKEKETDAAEVRYREARAEEKEMLVARLRGELIPVEVVKQQFADRAHEFTKALQLFARRTSLRLAGKSKKKYQDVFDIIEDEINAILGTYSRPVDCLRGVDEGERDA
jgi:hypothetical protein